MKYIVRIILAGLISFFVLAMTISSCKISNDQSIKILILSGNNNHDWQGTTSFLKTLFAGSDLLTADVTEKPDTLKSADLARYDVIVSNWNSWPENDLRWPEITEKALLNFISKGGGFVTFHSSSSAFYSWPEFKKISTAAWIMDSTWHGKNGITRVTIDNKSHPVTSGMAEFIIWDELWIYAEKNKNFITLGNATNEDISVKAIGAQPAIMVSDYGKGRLFHTILGHDLRTMRNTGFRSLLLRGTEWAATGKVTQPLPQELQEQLHPDTKELNWQKTDTTYSLFNGKEVIWQYNFNTKHGRPFFHPVYVKRNNVTCVSPDDHPWHLGQWFCWKYINGVNYWEYLPNSFQSEGITEIENISFTPNPDFSAEITLKIVYHPNKGNNVLAEHSKIKVSAPQKNGNIWMDYDFEFKAISDTVYLDRTPVEGEPNGQSWGGYAGLSVRFNQSFMNSHFISELKESLNINGEKGDWLYMGFTGFDGNQVGTQMMIDPETDRANAAWYSVNSNELPFYYFSPACLYRKPLMLIKDEKLNLSYRILHLNGEVNDFILQEEFNKFQNKSNQ